MGGGPPARPEDDRRQPRGGGRGRQPARDLVVRSERTSPDLDRGSSVRLPPVRRALVVRRQRRRPGRLPELLGRLGPLARGRRLPGRGPLPGRVPSSTPGVPAPDPLRDLEPVSASRPVRTRLERQVRAAATVERAVPHTPRGLPEHLAPAHLPRPDPILPASASGMRGGRRPGVNGRIGLNRGARRGRRSSPTSCRTRASRSPTASRSPSSGRTRAGCTRPAR